MKKLTLFLVAMLFSTLSFAALNPFAYDLSSNPNADQTELTINYSLNATATNVDFVLLDGDKVIKTVNLNDKGLAKGTYTAAIALDDPNMPLGKKLSWKIEVKGVAVSGYTMHDVKYNAYHPSSVDIDNNPESAHFGRILCNESMQKVKGLTKASDAATNGKNYLGTANGAGIFEFNAAFEYQGGYNGGKTFPINRYGVTGIASANQAYVPRRIRISDDGRIFVTSLNSEGDVLWELNPDNLNEWTTVIADGTRSTTYTETRNIVDGSGNFIAGPNVGFDVHGSGKDLKLVMLSSADEGWGFNQSAFKCVEYNLGTQKTWNKPPSKTIFTKLAVYPLQAQVQYDKDGGVWFTQYNSETNNSSKPGLAHWNVNNTNQTPDYIIARNNTRNAGFRYNNDYTKVIIANNSGNASIYDVTIKNGVPQLSNEVAVNMTAMGGNLNDFAWDYADNIYVVSNSKEFVAVYPSPHDANKVVSTPCASKYTFTINSAAQAAKASELNPYAYDLSSELSSDKKTLTIHYKLNANANAVSAVIMNGETEVKAFTCTGITRGEHSIAIPTAELPVGLKLTWQIKVDGTSKSDPTKVSTQYSLWGPYGLDIDKNPESEYFGRILATESYHGAKDLSGYLSTGQGGGLYVFTPDFATDGKVRNGEVNFTRKLASKGFQPFRVRISEDGRIFVTSLDINGVAVWEVSKDLQTWTPLLAGTNNSSDYRIYYNTSTFLAAPNASIDVTGTGDELKLLLYSASKDAISSSNQKWFRLDEYAMNGVETGETFPTSNTHKAIKAFNGYNLTVGSTTYKYGVAYNQSAVIYDGEGGYWFAGSRGNNLATEPNLAHVNASGVQDYYDTSDQMLGGAGILIHNHSTEGKVLFKGTKPSGTFKVYSLGKNADGTPKLDVIWTVTSGLGTNHNAFAVDYAENLYVVGNSKEKIFAFAMPYSGSVTTPCAAKYAFELEARGVVKRAVQLGESTIVLTHEADGTPYLYNVVGDVMTPISQNGVIARDADNPGDYLSISDIAVTEDGKLVACNYVRCQFVEGNVESGYKRGTLTFYVWNDLASDPAIWFQSKASSNSVNSDQGYTMAVVGTSTNADILVTGVHSTQRGVRMSHFSVVDGVYQDTENGQVNLPYYYYLGKKYKKTSAGVDAAVYREDAHGSKFQLSISPLAEENWIMDAELMEPSEFTNPQTNGSDPVVNSTLADGTFGKKFNGATFFTVNNLHFMVAPYADASGKVAGVKVLDINNGLAVAKLNETLELAAPIAGTAAATAVKVNGLDLTITLVVDADIYTFKTSIQPSVTYELNGGVWNEYGWTSKADMYSAILKDIAAITPLTQVGTDVNVITLAEDKNKGVILGIPTYWSNLEVLLNHAGFKEKWGWLIAYMDDICSAQSKTKPSTDQASLRFNLSAFFLEDKYTSWPYSADFTEAGKDAAYIPAWGQSYGNPENPTSEVTLYDPYRKGFEFDGWYTSADFIGSAVTKVDYTFQGTLYAKWSQSGIVYELNGGVWNQYGWTNKSEMFSACMTEAGVTGLASLDELKAKGTTAFTTICTPLGVENVQNLEGKEKWSWLFEYLMAVQNPQKGTAVGEGTIPELTLPVEDGNSANWRYAIAAFFLEMQNTAWPRTADFAEAGKDVAYIPTWGQSYGNPEQPATEVELYAPIKTGYTFEGWYANEDFSGEKVTKVNADYAGTLYAKWSKNSIAYNLNGGQYNQYGWENKGDICLALEVDYNATYGTSKDWVQKVDDVIQYNINGTWMTEEEAKGQESTVAGFLQASTYNTTDNLKKLIETTMVDKYGWLKDVIVVNREEQSVAGELIEAIYRKELSAFFLHSPAHSNWPASSSYEGAGELITYQTYWDQSFPNPTYPKSAVVLNAPYKEGYEFDGWYASIDFSGEKVTKVNANTSGTLYAKWTEKVIIIDERAVNSTALKDYNGQIVTAKVTRPFDNKSLKTLTLPFDMTEAQIQAVFGETAKVHKFTSVGEKNGMFFLHFDPTTTIEAGTPYIIELPETDDYDAKDGFTIEGVTISTDLQKITVDDITMQPILDGGGRLDQASQYWLASDNCLYSAGAHPTALLGLRAYFINSTGRPIRARVVYGENEATSIPTVVAPEDDVRKVLKDGQIIIIRGEKQYNIQGQVIE